jgi:hypothetical protein
VYLGHTGFAQGGLRGEQRSAGGDHVVDEQHVERSHRATRAELRCVEPLGPTAAGLRSTMSPVQQPPARQPQFACNRARQQLGLVETALHHPGTTGGRPCDHVDRHLGQAKTAHHQPSEVTCHGTPVAVLQREQCAARHPVERHGSSDAMRVDDGAGGGEREPTRPAQVGAGLEAAGTAVVENGEQGHGSQHAQEV